MDNWKGFSSEEISQYSIAKEAYSGNKRTGKSIVVNNLSENESLILKNQVSSPSRIALGKKRLINKGGNTLRKNDGQNCAIVYPIPQEAKLGNSSRIDDNISSSSLEMSLTSSSSQSSISQTPCNESSPLNTSAGQSQPVTILVGEDKSYKMINTFPNEEIPVRSIDVNGDSVTHPLQKAFLLEKNSSDYQNISLMHFQERQKLMEEQNKRKKELLAKAIADKKRQTQYEAKKILQIQEELSRLDALLSTDVSILRNQIELASYEFNEAQKRYDKAECEFIGAKMHLFTKLERKELLTEHLCKIIETNEQRKAKKLSELMAKLEISDENDDAKPAYEEVPVTPQSVSLNEIKYTARQTLKPTSNQILASKSCDSQMLPTENAFRLNPIVSRELVLNKSPSANVIHKSSEALQSINLITAQNLDHRNDNIPYNLDSEDS